MESLWTSLPRTPQGRNLAWGAALICAALMGCSDDGTRGADAGPRPVDTGSAPPPRDGGVAMDAAPGDGGTPRDGSAPQDARIEDGSAPNDGGSTRDAETMADGSVDPDAATPPDASADADAGGMVDTGVQADTGVRPDAGGPVDTGVPVDAGFPDSGLFTNFDPVVESATIADALCARDAVCSPFTFTLLRATRADCFNQLAPQYEAYFDALHDTVTASAAYFVPDEVNRCLVELATADCTIGLSDTACRFFIGRKSLNSACALDEECPPTAFCDAPYLGACGICRPKVAARSACSSSAECRDGLTCLAYSGGATPECFELKGQGDVCGSSSNRLFNPQDGHCRGLLTCTQNGFNSTCLRRAPAGAPCTDTSSIERECETPQGYYCRPASPTRPQTCTAAVIGTTGDSCTYDGPNFCDRLNFCDFQSATCQAQPGPGQPCRFSTFCAPGAYCDGTLCQAPQGAGAPCTSPDECASPLACFGPPGMETCQRPSWRTCP